MKIRFDNETGGGGCGFLREYFDLMSEKLTKDSRLETDSMIYDMGTFDTCAGPIGSQRPRGVGDHSLCSPSDARLRERARRIQKAGCHV